MLQNHEIRDLMPLTEYIEAVAAGYRELGLGKGVNFPRQNLWIRGDPGQDRTGGHLPAGSKGSLKFKAGLLPVMGAGGVQAYTAGLPGGMETYMFLFDAHTGALSAIMEVLYYDWLKTAAVAAVATDYLAPPAAEVVGLFGTGRHARTQLHGLCAVRPIRRVQAFSRRAGPRKAFCRQMTDELEIEVVAVDSPERALDGADIVTTISTSTEPVFSGRDLSPGPVHINAMGAHYPWVREVDDHVVLNSRIILDEWQQGLTEHGEILLPMHQGLLSEDDIYGDLGAVVAGRISGREATTGWTLFLSGGTGVEDVAVATRLVEKARVKDIGTSFAFNQPYEFEL